MLFKRRQSLPLYKRALNFIWPSMGWVRVLKYYKHRTTRIPDSSYSIAAGLAIGCGISFTPTFGTQLLQTVFICWAIRANILAGIIGTAFGNPWTFPFLLWVSYQVGVTIFWLFGFGYFFEGMPKPMELGDLLDYPMKFLLPMLIGGYACMALCFPLFYYPFYYMIRGAKATRRRRLQRKAHKIAQEVTGQKS